MCREEHPAVDCRRVAAVEVCSGGHLDNHLMVENKVREIVTPQAVNKMFELTTRNRDTHKKTKSFSRELPRVFGIQKMVITRFPFRSAVMMYLFLKTRRRSFR